MKRANADFFALRYLWRKKSLCSFDLPWVCERPKSSSARVSPLAFATVVSTIIGWGLIGRTRLSLPTNIFSDVGNPSKRPCDAFTGEKYRSNAHMKWLRERRRRQMEEEERLRRKSIQRKWKEPQQKPWRQRQSGTSNSLFTTSLEIRLVFHHNT